MQRTKHSMHSSQHVWLSVALQLGQVHVLGAIITIWPIMGVYTSNGVFSGCPWGVSGTCPGGPRGVPGEPMGVLGSQGRACGFHGIPGASGDVPGILRIFFIKMIP